MMVVTSNNDSGFTGFHPTFFIYIYLFPCVGKFHQNLERMNSYVIVNSAKSFNRHVTDVRFVDFLVISPTVAVITRDGTHIFNKSNIPSIR